MLIIKQEQNMHFLRVIQDEGQNWNFFCNILLRRYCCVEKDEAMVSE